MDTSEKYYTAGKSLGIFALTATLVMTELNTSTLIGFSSLGYIYGSSAISLGMVFLIGLLFYTFVVAKKWKRFDAITVSEFFSQRYNPIFGFFVAICLLVAMLGFGANFIHSVAICFQQLFPEYNHWLISGIACLIMLLFTIRDGLLSIVRIDRLSFIFSLLFCIYLAYLALNMDVSFFSKSQEPGIKVSLPISFSISLAILTAFTYILSPWYGQKIFAAKSAKVAFYSVLLTSIIVSLFYLVAVFATAKYSSFVSGISPDRALIIMISQLFAKPAILLFYIVLFLIALTTIAALWNTMASICFVHFQKNKTKKNSVITVCGIAILSYFIANEFIDQILDKMLLFNIPIAALAFSLLYGFYGKRLNLVGAICSVIIGIISSFVCYLLLDQESFVFYWATVCIPVSFIVGYLPVFFLTDRKTY